MKNKGGLQWSLAMEEGSKHKGSKQKSQTSICLFCAKIVIFNSPALSIFHNYSLRLNWSGKLKAQKLRMKENSIKSHLGGRWEYRNKFHTQIPTNALQTYLTAQGFRKKYKALSLPHHWPQNHLSTSQHIIPE